MPKNNINYSNTIVYKIYCKDELITDIYVGHTTNFFVRKYQHKISCKKSELKIYKTIRNNGGWDNWNMVEIAKYNCNDSIEARIMEQKHYEELNATLNSCPPYVDTAKYFCSMCNKQCNSQLAYETHINCILHNKKTQIETTTTKNKTQFNCIICDFNCFKQSNYDKHLLTSKHKNRTI